MSTPIGSAHDAPPGSAHDTPPGSAHDAPPGSAHDAPPGSVRDIPPGSGHDVPLGSVHDIPPGEGRTYAVGSEMIAVFRLRDGTVRALAAVCPHKGGPLADGQIDRRQVVCPLHQYAWDLATGCSLSGQDDVASYPVHVNDDDLILLGDPT